MISHVPACNLFCINVINLGYTFLSCDYKASTHIFVNLLLFSQCRASE